MAHANWRPLTSCRSAITQIDTGAGVRSPCGLSRLRDDIVRIPLGSGSLPHAHSVPVPHLPAPPTRRTHGRTSLPAVGVSVRRSHRVPVRNRVPCTPRRTLRAAIQRCGSASSQGAQHAPKGNAYVRRDRQAVRALSAPRTSGWKNWRRADDCQGEAFPSCSRIGPDLRTTGSD